MRINEIKCDCCGDIIFNGDKNTYRLTLKSPDGISWRLPDSIDLCPNCESSFHPDKILERFREEIRGKSK